MAALLGHIRGREIDRDAACWERKAGGDERRAHSFTRLGYRLVGEADHIECGQPRRHLDLDINGTRLDALKRHCCDPLDHTCPCLRSGTLAHAIILDKNN